MRTDIHRDFPILIIPPSASLVMDELDLKEMGEVIDSVFNYFILDGQIDVYTGDKLKDVAIKMIIAETERERNRRNERKVL